MNEAFATKLEEKFLEALPDLQKSDPELLRQVVGSIMGVKIPRKTLDDMVMETIGDDPTLRREWAEARLQQMTRNGRTEMDIVGEGLDMLLKILQESEAQNWDSASQLAAMDQEGIDLAVLFPTRGLLTLGTGDLEPGLATAISRAYNDWLADFCAGGKGRMFGAGMLLPHDVEGHSHGDYMPGFALFERTYQPPRTRI